MTCTSCGASNEVGRKFCGECGTRLAAPCPSCGTPNAPGVRFCGECGNALAVTMPSPAPAALADVPVARGGAGSTPAAAPRSGPVAERRLVSVLFADLVGFTALAEGRDPEAVRELLAGYFEQATEVITRYGGSVEKFIGDAVMAVWGAPTAHEDDAERAVRAGLELVDAVRTLGPGIHARAGVMTGEAAVTLGATGQGMVAGDLVNTASRLQAAAAPGTVLVGEETHQATADALAYELAGEHVMKGKVVPVQAWRAMRVVAQRRGRGRDDRLEAPFVGRDAELRLLKDLFHATSRERRVRLVSITGQAGIGKSRLAWEFLKYVDGVVETVWWHEGRSPAYGEGITFWALGEMVRSRARLLETDDQATTRTRIADMVAEYVPDEAERRRIEPALLALLGVGEAPVGAAAELFGAWRTFFERLAATGVVALLFEDLQWADSGTLDFIEHVLEWSRNVPILIITLARPELLDRRPGWGAGRRAFLALDLQPLDELSMRELLGGLVPGLPEPAVRSIVARADGMPLYAVETIRMLVADGRLVARAGGGYEPVGELGELAVPTTLHALIAARLDGIDPDDRSLLQDASVLGQSFTASALAAIAGTTASDLELRLERLVRGDLLHVEVDPRSPERGQYVFVQALIREVAYSTLALRDRRTRHLAAARHFESLGDDELAGALAAHYVAAYRASSEGEEADALAAQARVALRSAAARAERLGAPLQAVSFLEQALEVSVDDADRASLLEQAGAAAAVGSQADVAVDLLSRAVSLREAGDDLPALAWAMALRGDALSAARRREEAQQVLDAAIDRFGDLGDDPRWIRLLMMSAKVLQLNGEYARSRDRAGVALARAERLGLIDVAAGCLQVNGMAAFFQGRLWEASALLRGSGELAEQAGLQDIALRSSMTLASIMALDDPATSVGLQKEALALCRRLGRRSMEINVLGNVVEDGRRTGDWDWSAAELGAARQLEMDAGAMIVVDAASAMLALLRGQAGDASIAEVTGRLGSLEDRDMAAGAFDLDGMAAFGRGDWATARDEWLKSVPMSDLNAPYTLPRVAVAAVLARDPVGARAALDQLAELGTRGRAVDADRTTVEAGIAALAGSRDAARVGYRAGAAAYRDLGLAWDEALLGLQAAATIGPDDPEVAGWVEASRVILARLGAAPVLAQLEAIVASATPSGGAVAIAPAEVEAPPAG
jgi:class 3 adenylate cyclase/tetratricopeptide (TPR) repeat protein